MNKNRYRVIYNKVRGLLMVVSEITKVNRSVGVSSNSESCLITAHLFAKLAPISLLVFGFFGWVNVTQANVVADGRAVQNLQPEVINTANGVPQVNIQTPSTGGVSRNQYRQFDIDNRGVILNNSRQHVKTELGGYVEGNPFLIGGEAKVILNEVNSNNPSRLNGFIEVAGKKAQLIIANPSGITCDGCGFINAYRSTLTTGDVLINGTQITGYKVKGGAISIQGKGLDSGRQDYTELLARSVEINAKVWAKNLDIISGRNQISTDLSSVEQLVPDEKSKPNVAIDVSSLGGMYANSIHLIGTENGLGVYNSGEIGAQAGTVTINANGMIVNNNSIASSQGMLITSEQDIINQGKLHSKQQLQLTAKGEISNQNKLESEKSIHLQAGENITSHTLLAYQDVVINAQGSVTNTNEIHSRKNLSIKADKNINNEGGIFSGGTIIANSAESVNNQKVIQAEEDVTLTAKKDILSNTTIAKHQVNLTANNSITSDDLISAKEGKVNLKAGQNIDSKTLYAKEGILVESGHHFNNQSVIKSDAALSITAGGQLNSKLIVTQGSIDLEAKQSINNSDSLTGKDNVNLKAGTDINSHIINADRQLRANAGRKISNNMLLRANQDIELNAGSDITSEKVVGLSRVTLSAKGNIINKNTLAAQQQLFLQAGGDILSQILYAGSDLSIRSGKSMTNKEHLQSLANLTLMSDENIVLNETLGNGKINMVAKGDIQHNAELTGLDSIDLNAGKNLRINTLKANRDVSLTAGNALTHLQAIHSQENVKLIAGADISSQGELLAKKDILLKSDGAVHSLKLIEAGGDINVSAKQDINSHLIAAKQNIDLTSGANLYHHELVTSEQGRLTLNADGQIKSNKLYAKQGMRATSGGDFINQTLVKSDDQLTINSGGNLESNNIITQGDINVNAKGSISNSDLLLSQNSITLNADQYINTHRLVGEKQVTLQAGQKITNNKFIQAKEDLRLKAEGDIISETILGLSQIDIQSQGHVINKKTISAKQQLKINALDDLLTQVLYSGKELTLLSGKSIHNAQKIESHGDVSVDAGKNIEIDNLLAKGNVNLTAGKDIFTKKMVSEGDVTIDAQDNITSEQLLAAHKDLRLNARGNIESETLYSKNNIHLTNGGKLVNSKLIEAERNITAIAGDNIVTQTVLAHGDLNIITQGELSNTQLLASKNNLSIQAGNDSLSRKLYAKNNLLVNVGGAFKNSDSVDAGGSVDLVVGNNIFTEKLVAQKDITINAGANITNGQHISGQGNVQLSADGDISSELLYANQHLSIKGKGSLKNNQLIQSDKNLSVIVDGNINSHNIKALGQANLIAGGDLTNQSVIAAKQDLNIQTGQKLISPTLYAQGKMTLRSGSDLISQELIQAGDDFRAKVKGNLISSKLQTLGNADIDVSGQLINGHGIVAEQDLMINVHGNIDSSTLYAKKQLTLNSDGTVNNSEVIQADEDLALMVSGDINSKKIVAKHDANVKADGNIKNTTLIAGQHNLTMTAGGDIDSSTIYAKNNLDVSNSGNLINSDTIQADGDMRLLVGKNMTSEKIISLRNSELQVSGFIDNAGLIASAQNLSIRSGRDLTSHTLFAKGDAHLKSQAAINATVVQADNQLDLVAATDFISNKVIAGNDLSITVDGKMTNQDIISSQGNLTINAENDVTNNAVIYAKKDIQIYSGGDVNNQDIIQSDRNMSIKANDNINSQKITSFGDLSLESKGDLINHNNISAQGDILIKQGGNVNNHNTLYAIGEMKIDSGKQLENHNILASFGDLTINAYDMTNHRGAFLGAGVDQKSRLSQNSTLTLNINSQLINYGVLDSSFSLIKVHKLINRGDAQIYANRMAIQAGSLDNLSDGKKAAVIAARNEMDLATVVLNNRDHSLIYSDGDMRIGGELSQHNHAVGRGEVLNNHSSIIEAANNLSLVFNTVNNVNDRLETEVHQISKQNIVEYQAGTNKRYHRDQVSFVHDEVWHINTPEVRSRDNYNEYRYIRTIEESVITHSEPAKIMSGQNMQVKVNRIVNDKSHIVAGNHLQLNANSIDNIDAKGKRITTDVGQAINYYRIHKRGRDNQGTHTHGYQPAAVVEEITLRQDSQQTQFDLESLARDGTSIAHPEQAQTREQNTVNLTDQLVNVSSESIDIKEKQLTVTSGQEKLSSEAIALPESKLNVLLTTDACPEQQIMLTEEGTKNPELPNDTHDVTVDVGKLPQENLKGSGKVAQATSSVDKNTTFADDQVNTPDVSIQSPTIKWPDNSLFKQNPDKKGGYLIETDPRFTNSKKWLSSDYMLDRLTRDPNHLHKRLGDGFYEQRMIRQKIIDKTGLRYLEGYHSDEEQFRDLMESGISFAEKYNLTVGVSLTAEQMEHLTSDIVWLVERTIQLPDGSQQTVLVPQVYTRVKSGDLDAKGALLSGRNVNIELSADFDNSGKIRAGEKLTIKANDINNIAGLLSANELNLLASNNINQEGGHIEAGDKLLLKAGNNINISSTLNSNSNDQSSHTNISQIAGVSVRDGDMLLQAGQDINLAAAQLLNQSKQGKTQLSAGNDVNFNTLTTENSQRVVFDSDNYTKQHESQEIGSKLISNGDVTIDAKHDANFIAAEISTTDQLLVTSGNDINIQEGRATVNYENRTKSSGNTGGGAKISNETFTLVEHKNAIGSKISGESIQLDSGNDVLIQGSQVVTDKELVINADQQVNIKAATQDSNTQKWEQEKRSGLMSSGGIGFTVGKINERTTTDTIDNNVVSSVIGSTEGSVKVNVDKDVNIHASDVIANKNIDITGQNVNIQSVDNIVTEEERYEREHSGFTLALGGTVADVYEAVKTIKESQSQQNDKLAALKSIKAGLSAIESIQETQKLNGSDEKEGISVSVSLTYGQQKTESENNFEAHSVISSTVSAANDLSITARGDENKQGGDINLIGSELRAGHDINLTAKRDFNAIGSVNTQHSDSETTTKGGSVGISIGIGQGAQGIRATGSANFSKERENMNGSAWTESIVDAKNKLTVTTGQDAKIVGAQLKGDTVKADIGRDLTIRSLQDTDEFDYDKVSGSVSASGGFGGFDANLALSKTKIDSEYASVTDQSGISAGKGGFGIKVGEHTQLDGAVIVSEASEEKNHLDTGTLGFSDIENKADFSVEHVSISLGTSGIAPPVLINKSGKASSVTYSAVGKGEIIVRDEEKQRQDVGQLSRNTENANNPLEQIFDKQKELERIETLQLVADISKQVGTVLKNNEIIKAQNEAKKEGLSDADKAKAREQLSLADPKAVITDEMVNNLALTNKVNDKMKNNATNMGGSVSKAIDSVTAIVQGIVGGNIVGGLAGASAPHIAGLIKDATLVKDERGNVVLDAQGNPKVDTATNALLHGLLGAVTGQLGSSNALAGAMGAMTGEAAAELLYQTLYGSGVVDERKRIRKEDLTEDQKQNIAALAGLTGALAGALSTSGDMDGAGEALATAKNAVENNYLSPSPFGNMNIDGLKERASLTENVMNNVMQECGPNGCSTQQIKDAFAAAGIRSTEPVPDWAKSVSYMIPGAGLVYGVKDSLKEGSWSPLVQGAAGTIVPISGVVNGAKVVIGVSLAANGSYQISTKPLSEFSFVDFGVAGVVGAATRGRGFAATEVISIGGAGAGAVIKRENPIPSMVGAGVGAGVGFVGSKAASAAGKKIVSDKASDIFGSGTGAWISEITSDKVKETVKE